MGFTFLYMPIWSLEELVECKIAMYPEMSDAELRSRFDRWGGIPRFVLEKLDEANQGLLAQAIASATLPVIMESVGHISAHPEVSHRILHLHVEADFVTTTVRWASTWVAEEVAMRLFQYKTNQVIAFLSGAAVSKDLGGIPGILWEGYCHRVLAAGGKFACRHLGTANKPFEGIAQDITIEPSTRSHIVDSWLEVKELPHTVYSRPRIKNLPAVDSAMQPNRLYQITVSSSHTVNCKGLHDALAGMQDDKRQVSLFFVVPTDKFLTFKTQKIAQGLGVAALRDQVNQFVLEVSLTQ